MSDMDRSAGMTNMLLRFVSLGMPLLVSGLTAQEAPPIELTAPTGVAEVRFTLVRAVRELRDGTLLVADRGESRLVHVTWAAGGGAVIGRRGEGPGEYRGVGALFPLAGDSTLFVDSFNGRWNLIVGQRIVETLGRSRPVSRELGGKLLGTDEVGHVLGFQDDKRPGTRGLPGTTDSLFLVLGDRSTGQLDTVARVKGSGNAGSTMLRASRGRPAQIIGQNPLAARDEAILFLDGWIAVARAEAYRVDWRDPEGRWHWGRPLPFDALVVDDEVRCFAVERFFRNSRSCQGIDLPGWPDIVPPFVPERAGTLFATPSGSVAVTRMPTPESASPRYDLVDRSGRLVGVLVLDPNQALIGFGVESVYVLSTDEVDLQTLTRHAWRFER